MKEKSFKQVWKPMICSDCGREKKHYAKGLCKTCYYRYYLKAYRSRPEYKEQRREYNRRWKTKLKNRRLLARLKRADSWKYRFKHQYFIENDLI